MGSKLVGVNPKTQNFGDKYAFWLLPFILLKTVGESSRLEVGNNKRTQPDIPVLFLLF